MYAHTFPRAYMCVHECTQTTSRHAHAHKHTHSRVCARTHTHTFTRTHTLMNSHILTRTCSHTRSHTHAHESALTKQKVHGCRLVPYCAGIEEVDAVVCTLGGSTKDPQVDSQVRCCIPVLLPPSLPLLHHTCTSNSLVPCAMQHLRKQTHSVCSKRNGTSLRPE